MNIALIADTFYPHSGTVPEVVLRLATEYKRSGHTAIVLTDRSPSSLPPLDELFDIPVYRIPFRVPDGRSRAHATHGLTYRQLSRETIETLVRRRIAVLHAHSVGPCVYYALQARRKLNLPLVLSVHGEMSSERGDRFRRSAFLNALLRQAVAEADFLTCSSDCVLQELERLMSVRLRDNAGVAHSGSSSPEPCAALSSPSGAAAVDWRRVAAQYLSVYTLLDRVRLSRAA